MRNGPHLTSCSRRQPRVIAKVEWHPGELYPRVGFIVTNLSRPADRVVAFYNKRGRCEQWIAIRYCALHAAIASGRVRLATDGGAKIAR